MASTDTKPELDRGGSESGGERPLHAQIVEGMVHAAGEWMRRRGQMDVYEARMGAWQRIHDALPSGEFQKLHGRTQGLAEFDAHVADLSGRGKDAVWTFARRVIAADAPLVLLLPDHTPSTLDALSAQAGGYLGEAAIKGSVAAYKGAEGVLGATRRRIDAAMASILSGSAMRSVPAGGAV